MSLCQDSVFVVTKGGRRADPKNFLTYEHALSRANSLIASTQAWDKPSELNKIRIVKTKTPYSIR